MNAIKLSDHFDYKRLLRYCLPSIIMMLFTSIYYIVDGFFVSNFAGKTPFAAVNLIMPLLLALFVFGSDFVDIRTECFGLSLGLFGAFYLIAYPAPAAAEHLVEKIHLSADEVQSAKQYDKVNYLP